MNPKARRAPASSFRSMVPDPSAGQMFGNTSSSPQYTSTQTAKLVKVNSTTAITIKHVDHQLDSTVTESRPIAYYLRIEIQQMFVCVWLLDNINKYNMSLQHIYV